MRSFVNMKPSRVSNITLSSTDIRISYSCREFLTSQIRSFNAIRANKILAKISEFTVTIIVCRMS